MTFSGTELDWGRSRAPPAPPAAYAELQLASAFSFLEGASLPDELVATAAAYGHTAIGVADRNTVAGVVRVHEAAKHAGLRLLVGARLSFSDGTPDLLCYPETAPPGGG